ncbi:MAG: four helix bundle protein [Sulfuricella sp.]|jgi:four helix bundle protein|nr:four helix bundle protein [Sulfuricella sp.]
MVSGDRQAVSGKPHTRLEAWKSAMDLVEVVYRITASFPASEQFGLVSQMRRASVSVPSNLAEGAARDGAREFVHFLSIAKGSLSELDTQYQLAQRLGLIKEGHTDLAGLIEKVSKLVAGLHKKIKEGANT